MPQRISLSLEDNIVKKLRMIQAKQIKDSEKSVSFSKVINDILKNSL